MKKITIITAIIASTITAKAQIPNGSFETWENYVDLPPYNNTYQKPDQWVGALPTSAATHSFSIGKNVDNYPAGTGQYSILVQSDLPNGVSGVASSYDANPANFSPSNIPPAFPVNYRPASLCLYYKYLPANTDTMMISCIFYKNHAQIGGASYHSPQTVSSWTPLTIPITFGTADVPDSATIFLLTFYNNNSKQNGSKLYVDNLNFDNLVTSISEPLTANSGFNLFPNPASDNITLNFQNSSKNNTFVNIYNVVGELIHSEQLQQDQQKINVADLCNGIYMVEVGSNEGSEKQKLVIQK
jgi:Secretion system C-terminal sorting domain